MHLLLQKLYKKLYKKYIIIFDRLNTSMVSGLPFKRILNTSCIHKSGMLYIHLYSDGNEIGN